jgi:hypothetical protein
MTDQRSAEDRIALWLEQEAAGFLPDQVLDATFERTRGLRQARRSAWRPSSTPRPIPALIAAGAAAVVISLVVSGLPREPDSNGAVIPTTPIGSAPMPVASPSEAGPSTAQPTAQPTTDSEEPWSEPFESRVHGYRIWHPLSWMPARATVHSKSDTFDAPYPSTTRLSILRRSRPADESFDLYVETIPHRAKKDGCHWATSGVIFIPLTQRPFTRTTIAGRDAVVREECGFVDAVIDVEGDVLVIALRTGQRTPGGDRYTFDRFMETLELEPPAPAG